MRNEECLFLCTSRLSLRTSAHTGVAIRYPDTKSKPLFRFGEENRVRGYGAGARKRSCGMEQTRLDDVGADDLGGPLYDPLPRQTGRFVNRPYE